MDNREDKDKSQKTISASDASGRDLNGQTLLPMLIGGLILIFVAMVVVVVLV